MYDEEVVGCWLMIVNKPRSSFDQSITMTSRVKRESKREPIRSASRGLLLVEPLHHHIHHHQSTIDSYL